MHDYMDADVDAAEVVFVGDCEVYECFSPVTLWQEHGIESRVVGTPQQLLWHSYAVLEQVFERSHPRVIVLGVYGLIYDEPQSEAYNRMVLDGLPWSATKREVVRASLTEGEQELSYLVPLLRYHDRWSQLTWRDVSTLFVEQEPISSCGYLVKTDVVSGVSSIPNHEGAMPPTDTAFGEQALYWFDRIVTLCEQNEAALVLVKSPTDSWRYPWYDEYEQQTVALAEQYGLCYYNLLQDVQAMGLDMTTDSYDGGLHLNVYGAEKLSRHFGQLLKDQLALSDTRKHWARSNAWAGEIARYENMKGTVSP